MILNQIKYFAKAKIKPQSGIQFANIVNLSDIKAYFTKNIVFNKTFLAILRKIYLIGGLIIFTYFLYSIYRSL